MENDKKIVTVIFSRNRSLQIDLCLRTLQLHCADIHKLSNVAVLYKADDPHKVSYEILKREYPDVNFVEEVSFKQDLLDIVHDKSVILFCVDDTIFTEDFLLANVVSNLDGNPDCLGFSLRLGLNTNFCFPYGKSQDIPATVKIENGVANKYNWQSAQLDFGYPLELSSSAYRLEDINEILNDCKYSSPNSLEDSMVRCHIHTKPNLLMYDKSVAFSNPINKVQTDHPNKSGDISADVLLQYFMAGYRINAEPFNQYKNTGAHELVNIEVKKNE